LKCIFTMETQSQGKPDRVQFCIEWFEIAPLSCESKD
jgi:hypothetical protein